MIFGEPEADLFALPDPSSLSTEFQPSETAATPAVKVRASLLPLAKKVRAGRTLKLVLGSSADTSGEADPR